MLILARKTGESIWIGENIRIYYLGQARGGGIKLGIDAPKEIKIWRHEVKEMRTSPHGDYFDWIEREGEIGRQEELNRRVNDAVESESTKGSEASEAEGTNLRRARERKNDVLPELPEGGHD